MCTCSAMQRGICGGGGGGDALPNWWQQQNAGGKNRGKNIRTRAPDNQHFGPQSSEAVIARVGLKKKK